MDKMEQKINYLKRALEAALEYFAVEDADDEAKVISEQILSALVIVEATEDLNDIKDKERQLSTVDQIVINLQLVKYAETNTDLFGEKITEK